MQSSMESHNVSDRLSTHPHCAASVAVNGKVEELGRGYNELEDYLHKLEQAQKDSDVRVSKLNDQIRSRGEDRQSRSLHPTPAPSIEPSEQAIEQHHQHDIIQDPTLRLQTLEHRSAPSRNLHSLSTHELAKALLERLRHGDILYPTDRLHLHLALNATPSFVPRIPFPETPVTYMPSKVGSTADLSSKGRRFRPCRADSTFTSKGSSDSDIKPKRKAGRLRKHESEERKSSSASSSHMSDASGSSGSFEAGTQTPRSQYL